MNICIAEADEQTASLIFPTIKYIMLDGSVSGRLFNTFFLWPSEVVGIFNWVSDGVVSAAPKR